MDPIDSYMEAVFRVLMDPIDSYMEGQKFSNNFFGRDFHQAASGFLVKEAFVELQSAMMCAWQVKYVRHLVL